MRSGILLIDKPTGITSAGVVARVKRALRADKVGHAGTLDPDATGLLIILVNGATKVASYAADGTKRYSGVIQFGLTTSTDDIAGEILTRSELLPDFSEVVRLSKSFLGTIEQIPPRVSAVKINGRRAHDRARKGEEFEIKARSVEVFRFDLAPLSLNRISYVIECSPGTYVRSLGRDLGAALGCGGTVESIRREASGGFSVDDAISFEDASYDTLKDWTSLLPRVSAVRLPRGECEALLNGRQESLRALTSHPQLGGLQSEALISYGCDGGSEYLGLLKKNGAGEIVIQVNVERSVD